MKWFSHKNKKEISATKVENNVLDNSNAICTDNEKIVKIVYNIGDYVWLIVNGIVIKDMIYNISIDGNEVEYGVGRYDSWNSVRYGFLKENQIFKNQDDLYNNIISQVNNL